MTPHSLIPKDVFENTRFVWFHSNVYFHSPAIFHVPAFILVIPLILVVILANYHNSRAILIWLGAIFIAGIFCQSIAQVAHFLEVEKAFHNKSNAEINNYVWEKEFNMTGSPGLIDCAHRRLRGQQLTGQLIMNLAWYRSTMVVFRYKLYPVIDLISPTAQPQALLCFGQSKCLTGAPQGYHVICSADRGYIAILDHEKRE